MTHSKAAPHASMESALAAFRQKFPTFEMTQLLDHLRATEYARLDEQQQVYLDYTGGGQYADCQLRELWSCSAATSSAIPIPRIRLPRP